MDLSWEEYSLALGCTSFGPCYSHEEGVTNKADADTDEKRLSGIQTPTENGVSRRAQETNLHRGKRDVYAVKVVACAV